MPALPAVMSILFASPPGPASARSIVRCVAPIAVLLAVACSNEDDTRLVALDPNGDADSGVEPCDGIRCPQALDDYQARGAQTCPQDYAAARQELAHVPGESCSTAFFECEGVRAAAYQYGFPGDNVQCYYGADGTLVGVRLATDHGTLLAGEVPGASCYAGPECAGDPDGGADAGATATADAAPPVADAAIADAGGSSADAALGGDAGSLGDAAP